MKKKFLAVLLACMIAASIVPAAVSANDSQAGYQAAYSYAIEDSSHVKVSTTVAEMSASKHVDSGWVASDALSLPITLRMSMS